MKAICPKDCPFRTATCHSCCKTYANGRKKLDELNRKIKKEKSLNGAIAETRTIIARIAIQKKGEHNV